MLHSSNNVDKQIIEETHRFVESELSFDPALDSFDRDVFEKNWQACAKQGILGANIPQSLGGQGLSVASTIAMLEALGYAFPDDGFTLGVNGQMWAVQEPIMRFGTEEQKERFLPPLINGSSIGAHGMTEESSGSNAFGLKTTATKSSDGYILNGKKIYIGLGPIADLILVFASTDPEKGRWGISCFVVDAKTDGVTLSAPQEKMGLRTAPLGEIEFKDAFVDSDRLLGREGAGASIFNASMQFERSFIFTSHVGAMAKLLDQTIQFVRQRDIGSGSIGKHQSVSNRIADMKVRLETCRLFLYQAADCLDAGKAVAMEAAMAKLVISENYVQNCMDAIRIHGGRGYLSEHGIERKLRDAMGGIIYSGTSDIQRNLIAGILGIG